MLRTRVWALLAILVAGSGAATAGDPRGRPTEQTTLVDKLFHSKKAKTPDAPTKPITINAPMTPEAKADALRAERDALLRRLDVCTELRRSALERNDQALARQADELERQVAELYNARVAGLGVARVKSPLPTLATSSVESDLDLGRNNDTRARAERLTAPASPIPATATAQVREVKP